MNTIKTMLAVALVAGTAGSALAAESDNIGAIREVGTVQQPVAVRTVQPSGYDAYASAQRRQQPTVNWAQRAWINHPTDHISSE